MKKIILATIIALGLTTSVQADTVCKVHKVATNYKTTVVKTPITTSYQERVYYNVQCGTTLVDIPNSNNMKEVKQFCSGSNLITKYRKSNSYKNVKEIDSYNNYYMFEGVEYIRTINRPLKTVTLLD